MSTCGRDFKNSHLSQGGASVFCGDSTRLCFSPQRLVMFVIRLIRFAFFSSFFSFALMPKAFRELTELIVGYLPNRVTVHSHMRCITDAPPWERCEFLKSRPHVLISYWKLHKQNCSSALPETSRAVAYIFNQNSPIRSIQQQQKSFNHCCNILKLMSKKFDAKL